MEISVVIPVYNEEKSIPELFSEIVHVLEKEKLSFEIVAVNDASKDGSWGVMKKFAINDPRIKLINFRSNYGQTSAMSAGIKNATGNVIVPIDSDLENDPADIPKLLKKMKEGYTVVSGWRKDRWGNSAFTRKFPSIVANWLISRISGVYLHDYGCTLKAYERDIIQEVELYGEMHRFIPAYAKWKGGNVAEIPVAYRPRKFGKSSYGMSRIFRVLPDLILLKFFTKYMNRPIHFFGGLGFTSFAFGVISGLTAIGLKLAHLRDFVETPLPIFSALFIIVGVQLIVMGVLAEMVMRTYYESQNKTSYSIKERINFN